ncbi:hypothetical protein RYX36_011035 [Vicia faba]
MDLHQCLDNRRKYLPFVQENGYYDSFDSGVNNWLPFWLYLVTSSYFLLRGGRRIKSEENGSLSNKSIPNDRMINGSYSESLGSPYNSCSSTYFDAYLEISDLLSLEEEDSEWLSDSTPLSYNYDYFTVFSNVDSCSYWDSLLKLEEGNLDKAGYWPSLINLEDEDSKWLSDSMISDNSSTPLSYNSDSFTMFSYVDTPSYWDSLLKLEEEDNEWNFGNSLLSLEDEDSEWLLDSMKFENPSSSLSCNGDSFIYISDISTPSYWDSLLRLDQEENSDWILNSKQELECVQDGSPVSSYRINLGTMVLPPISVVSSFSGADCGKLEDVFSAQHLLETADIEEFNGDEPLFWPFEGEFDWDSEESSFCNSPRKRLVFYSNMDSPLEYFGIDQEFAMETLMGLKEFDGREGIDYEFISDGFMLEEFLQ